MQTLYFFPNWFHISLNLFIDIALIKNNARVAAQIAVALCQNAGTEDNISQETDIKNRPVSILKIIRH